MRYLLSLQNTKHQQQHVVKMHYSQSKNPSMGTPSVYSHMTHATTRSSAGLKSARSIKSLKVKWYEKPILQDAIILDIQRGCLLIAFYSLLLSIFTVITALFDIYCLAMAEPGSTHYGYYIISYQFVYVGNKHVRNCLIAFALFSLIMGLAVLVTSCILISALRKEHEHKMVPWLYAFAVFTLFRLFAFLFASIVNDLIFGYNILMTLLWSLFSIINVYGWVLNYSLFLELRQLSKIEDYAHLRMGTMASLNASTTNSLAGSRPTTPHGTVSTSPIQ
ncbi:hypothetical protein FOCC_FOCC016224 [Frankliniella occidentalis]|nr:hypothetical protein FOCC_FOCC016224 [Frankliniella occidentalis]